MSQPAACLDNLSLYNFGSLFLTTILCCGSQLLLLLCLGCYLHWVRDQASKGNFNVANSVILPSLEPIVWVCIGSTLVLCVLLLSEVPCAPNFFRLADDYSRDGSATVLDCIKYFCYWLFEYVMYLSVGILFLMSSMSRDSFRRAVRIGVLAALFITCLYFIPFLLVRRSLTKGSWAQNLAGAVDLLIDSLMIIFYSWIVFKRSFRTSLFPFAWYNICWHGLAFLLEVLGFIGLEKQNGWTDARYYVSLTKFFIRYFLFAPALYFTLLRDTRYWRGCNRQPAWVNPKHNPEAKGDDFWRDSKSVHSLLDDNSNKLIDFTKIKFGSKIGEGGSAVVYSGKYLGLPVAIKVFNPKELDEHSIASYHREAVMCYEARESPYSLKFYGLCVCPPDICLVFELCELGDLRQVLQKERLTWTQRLSVALQCVSAIESMHSSQHGGTILHRDIKPENFLIMAGLQVKLADLGLARRVASISSNLEGATNIGTPGYMSPELLRGHGYDAKTDIFSCTIVLWEIFTQKVAFANLNAIQVVDSILADARPPIDRLHKSLQAILAAGWSPLATERPSANTLRMQLQQFALDLESGLIEMVYSRTSSVPNTQQSADPHSSGHEHSGPSFDARVRAFSSSALRSLRNSKVSIWQEASAQEDEGEEVPFGSLQDMNVLHIHVHNEEQFKKANESVEQKQLSRKIESTARKSMSQSEEKQPQQQEEGRKKVNRAFSGQALITGETKPRTLSGTSFLARTER